MTEPPIPEANSALTGLTVVTSHLEAILHESEALRRDLAFKEATRRREIRTMIGVGVVFLLMLLLILVVVWQNNEVARITKANNDRIADCTTDGGKCYDDGKARTGDAIGNIIRAEIATLECSRLFPKQSGPTFDAKLRACVYTRLSAPPATPVPVTPVPATPVPSTTK